jgi:quercetin dioxygenase-like cupin family protein
VAVDARAVRLDDAEAVEAFPGVVRRTLAWGERVMACQTTIAAGKEVPTHAHPHEQITYVMSGILEVTVGDAEQTLQAGDSILIPAEASHVTRARGDVVLVDVFAPPREDFK